MDEKQIQAEEDLRIAFTKGEENLVNFYKIFLSDDDQMVESAPFHYEWSKELLEGTQNFAVEAFRECAKTAYVIRGHTMHRLVYPKKTCSYIILIMSNQTRAETKLKQISKEFLENSLLSAHLIKVVQDSGKAFEVELMDANGEKVKMRIEAYGKGSNVRGANWNDRRPDLVIIDDIQDLDDSESETIMESDWRWFLSDIKFLGQNTRIFMIGNNLGEGCIMERVMANPAETGFITYKIPALNEYDEPTWPAKFSKDFLEKEREDYRAIGQIDLWFRDRMCVALSPDSMTFEDDMFKYFDYELIRDKVPRWNTYITIDPALSEKSSADFTAIVVNAVNASGHWHILDIIFGRFGTDDFINKVFEAVSRYRPVCVGLEQVLFQRLLKFILEQEMQRRNVYFRIAKLTASGNKNSRIKLLQPRFKAGSIWLRKDAPWLKELRLELLAFPKGIHDDLADALAYQEQIAIPPTSFFDDDEEGGYSIPIAGSL